jgi:hypothetical protein
VRATPTLPGLLVLAGESVWGKWIWLAVLTLAVLLWLRRGAQWHRRTLIDVSIIVGLIVSPIGWSYDQIMLLLPILSLLGWVKQGIFSRRKSAAIIAVLLLVNVLTFCERILSPSEVWFFWVPIVVGAVYLYGWKIQTKGNTGGVIPT